MPILPGAWRWRALASWPAWLGIPASLVAQRVMMMAESKAAGLLRVYSYSNNTQQNRQERKATPADDAVISPNGITIE